MLEQLEPRNADMNRSYVVSTGTYSDYRVVAVFDSRQEAENYTATYGGTVEAYPRNPVVPPAPAGLQRYLIAIYSDRVVVHDRSESGVAGTPNLEGTYIEKCTVQGCWCAYVWAKDESHAAKIGNELRSLLTPQIQKYKPPT
jgi:hypothetical protein